YDWFRTNYPDVHLQATQLLPAREFPGQQVLNWKDLTPRLGFSYDVFGNGKTAVKTSLSHYPLKQATDLDRNVNPAVTPGGTWHRTWHDDNRDFIPQGDPLNPAANGELGPSPNNLFGQPKTTLRYDPDFSRGVGVRPNQWEFSAGLQHELHNGLSASAMYFR